ncbi:dynein heavy chain, N-terminal region 1-domain-containing protein [Mycena capillaripes]|nr:dynein heavy chain, N-terminal region 1-domain-containing protein [Mycena capillaripes]
MPLAHSAAHRFSPEVISAVSAGIGTTGLLDCPFDMVLNTNMIDDAVSKIHGAIKGTNFDSNKCGWIYPASLTVTSLAFAIGSTMYTDEDGYHFGSKQSHGINPFDILGDIFLKSILTETRPFSAFISVGPILTLAILAYAAALKDAFAKEFIVAATLPMAASPVSVRAIVLEQTERTKRSSAADIQRWIEESESNVTSLEQQITTLVDLRDRERITAAALRYIISPIYSVPVELLGEIFVLAIRDDTHMEDARGISQVCSDWRQVAHGTPQLWARPVNLVEIPETNLVIHPNIQRAVEQAQAAGSRPSINDLPPKLLNDSTFINSLDANVNSWIKSIQAVTKLTRDVTFGTASQEINFWLSLEREIEGIETQLRSEEVSMVMDCLQNAKQFRAFGRDGPRTQIQESITHIFGHINRKLRFWAYPIRRALPLVEAISRDFNDQVLRILTSHRLPYTPYETFDRLLGQVTAIFWMWDLLIKEFKDVARQVARKRSEKFIPVKVANAHAKLQKRCHYLMDWRSKHEQLAVMTDPTRGLGGGVLDMGIGGMDMEEEVKEAYEIVKRIDVLNLSAEGTETWVAAENAYNERVARIENQIIARLRDRVADKRSPPTVSLVLPSPLHVGLYSRPRTSPLRRASAISLPLPSSRPVLALCLCPPFPLHLLLLPVPSSPPAPGPPPSSSHSLLCRTRTSFLSSMVARTSLLSSMLARLSPSPSFSPPPRSSANPQPHALGHAFPTFPDTGLHTYDASAAHATVPLSTAPVRVRGYTLADSGSGSRTAAGLQGKLNEEVGWREAAVASALKEGMGSACLVNVIN